MVPGHVFVVDECAMPLEIVFLFGFVVAVLTVVPDHVFIVDTCAMLLEAMFPICPVAAPRFTSNKLLSILHTAHSLLFDFCLFVIILINRD